MKTWLSLDNYWPTAFHILALSGSTRSTLPSPYPIRLQPPATVRENVVRPPGANHGLLKV